jgi:hypothetical protein
VGISPQSWFWTSPFDFPKKSGVGVRSVIQRELVGRMATSKEDEEVAIEVTVKVVYCGGTWRDRSGRGTGGGTAVDGRDEGRTVHAVFLDRK